MINNSIFRQTVEESGIGVPHLSALTGIPEDKIEQLMDNDTDINAVQIQALSSVLELSFTQRKSIFFSKDQ